MAVGELTREGVGVRVNVAEGRAVSVAVTVGLGVTVSVAFSVGATRRVAVATVAAVPTAVEPSACAAGRVGTVAGVGFAAHETASTRLQDKVNVRMRVIRARRGDMIFFHVSGICAGPCQKPARRDT